MERVILNRQYVPSVGFMFQVTAVKDLPGCFSTSSSSDGGDC